MAIVKLCEGKSKLYQWDTGVQLEMTDGNHATEIHFVTPDGLIKRTVVDGVCDIPDAALQCASTLIGYVYIRDDDGGDTRHEFRLRVIARPKPDDYIDPPDEIDNLDQVAERVAGLIDPGDLNLGVNLKNGKAGASLRGLNAAEEADDYKLGTNALALGRVTKASGYNAFASGEESIASGRSSHAEGCKTTAIGNYAHTEGFGASAVGNTSHAEGLATIAASGSQHVQGQYNVEDTEGKYAHIVGNGVSNKRANAHTLDWKGNAWYKGDIFVGGANQDDASARKVVTAATPGTAGQIAVSDGAGGVTWRDPGESEGGSGGGSSAPEIMKVTFTSPDGGDNVEPDKTFAEMAEAIVAGKLLYAEIAVGIDFFDGQFSLYQATEDAIVFTRLGVIPGDTPMPAIQMVGVSNSNEVISEFVPTSGGSGAVIVNITVDNGMNGYADMTAEDIFASASAGSPVYANLNDGLFAPAQVIAPDQVVFRIEIPGGTIMAVIDDEGMVTMEVTPAGEDGSGGVVYVDVTESNGVYTTSMIADAIYTAHAAGKQIVCRVDLPKASGVLLQPTYISDLVAFFTGVFDDALFASNGSMLVTVAIPNDNEAQVTISTLDALPNPHPLVINGVSYDGSERVEMNVSAAASDAVVLADTVTGKQYRLCVTNGKLTMEEVIES